MLAGIKTQFSINAEKKSIFQRNVETFIHERIPEVVSSNILNLSTSVLKAMMEPILSIVRAEILKWQQHDYVTLNDFEQGLNLKIDGTLSWTYHRYVLSVGISDFVDSSVLDALLSEFVILCEKSGVIENQDASNLISSAKECWMNFEKEELPQCLPVKCDIKDCILNFSKSISNEFAHKGFEILKMFPPFMSFCFICGIAQVKLNELSLQDNVFEDAKSRFLDNASNVDFPIWLRKKVIAKADNIISEQKKTTFGLKLLL